jgi:hypothetical protein
MFYQLTNSNNNMSEQKPETIEPNQRVAGKFLFPSGVSKSATNSFKDYVYFGLDDLFLKLNPEYANKTRVKEFSKGRVRFDDLLRESKEEFYKLPLPKERIDFTANKKLLNEYLDLLKASGQNECVNCGYELKQEEKKDKYCPSCGSLMVYSQGFLNQLENRLKEYERLEESVKRGSETSVASIVNKFVNQEWLYYRDCFRDHPEVKKEATKILKLDLLLENIHALQTDLIDSFRNDITSYFNENFHKIFKFKILRYSSKLKKSLPFSFSRDELTGRVNKELFYPLFDNLRALFIKPPVDSYYFNGLGKGKVARKGKKSFGTIDFDSAKFALDFELYISKWFDFKVLKDDLSKEEINRIEKIAEILKQRASHKFRKIIVNRLETEWNQIVGDIIKLDKILGDETLLKQKISQLGDFSLKNNLLRAIRIRKQLSKILLERQIDLIELKRLGRGEGRIGLIDEVFSDATSKFSKIPFSHINFLYYILLRSSVNLTIAKKQQKDPSQLELVVELDENRAYRAFFDYFWLKFKPKSEYFRKLKLDFANRKNDFLPCIIERDRKYNYVPHIMEDGAVKIVKTLINVEESDFETRFFNNIKSFFRDFDKNLFEHEIKDEINLCKIRFTEIFTHLWKQFLKESPLPLSRVKKSVKPKKSRDNEVYIKLLKKIAVVVSFIAIIVFGVVFGSMFFNSAFTVGKYDTVKIDYVVWESDQAQTYDALHPLFDDIVLLNATPITENSEDGLILGLYNNLLDKGLNYDSGLIWLNKCIDQDRNGIDDNTGQPALTYGNSSDMYFNTCLMLQFKILDIQKYGYIPPIELDPAVVYGVITITLLIIFAGIVAFAIWKREPVQLVEKPRFIFLYDPKTLKKMTKENKEKRTKHYKDGFEPCYDWGAGTEFDVPKWAEEVVDKELKKGKKDGRIDKDKLPSILTVQKIEYCTYFYQNDELVLRAYRRILSEDNSLSRMSNLASRIGFALKSIQLKHLLYFPLVIFTAVFGLLLEQQPTLVAFCFFLTVLLSALFALGAVFLLKYLKRTFTSKTRKNKKTKRKSSQLKHFGADFIFVIVPLIVFIAICSVYITYYAISSIFYTISAKDVIPLIIGVWTVFWSLVLLKVYFSLRK